jgi:hypothetical protein
MSCHKDDFETRQRFSADNLTDKVTLVLFPTGEQLKFGSFAGLTSAWSRIHLIITHKIPTTPILSTIQPRAGSGPGETILSGLQYKRAGYKNLYTK